jgi:hypothetical protein
MERRRTAACIAIASALLMLLAGCASWRGPEAQKAPAIAPATRGLGQVAMLRPLGGSAVTGKLRVIDRGGGATLLVTAFQVPGTQIRIAFGDTANCTSPNGFSAGPAWSPPASKQKPEDLIRTLYADSGGTVVTSEYVAGLREAGPSGVAGHSVVIFSGSKVTAAHPDVPNERIACGVFEPATAFDF